MVDIACLIGTRIRELRKEKGIVSQEELASKAGVHRTFVGRVERGDTRITVTSLERILIGLNVSWAEFFEPFNDVGSHSNPE